MLVSELIEELHIPGIRVTLYLPPYLVGSKDSGERVVAVAKALLEGAAIARRRDCHDEWLETLLVTKSRSTNLVDVRNQLKDCNLDWI